MELQKAKILLDKINALYNNMNADSKNISSIERDLMKSYIQQLYESFLDMPGQAVTRSAVEVIKSKPKVTLNKPAVKKTTPAPPPAPAPEPAPVKQNPSPPPPPKSAPPKPAPVAVKPPKPEPVAPKTATPVSVSAELEELFSFNSAKELSEKLSEMPIKDIKKAMGLNERIFTVNELFGGDQVVFDLTVDTLNKLSDYDQAKSFLLQNAATKYKWDAKGRQKKAKNFIKLVKRRYN